MKKLFLFLGIFLIAVSLANAEENSADSCSVKTKAMTTLQLLNEISSLNQQISKCNPPLGSASRLVGDGTTQIQIAMKDGSTKSIFTEISQKKLTGISITGTNPKYIVNTDEDSLDYLISSDNKFGTFSTLYLEKKITINASTFGSKLKMFFMKPIFKFIAKKNKAPLE